MINPENYFSPENIERLIEVGILFLVGALFIHTVALLIKKMLPQKLSRQRIMIVNRLVVYGGYLTLLFIIVSKLNLNLTPVFGAAGVIGLVVGIASQTTIGNMVSGFFLIFEKSFEIGDVIKIGDKAGVVDSIDLLSIKIKTFDNLLLRIPNQTVISTELTNVTRFPIRRLDIDLSVAYKEDLEKVSDILRNVARQNPLCLEEPEPIIAFKNFGASGIDVMLGVWFEKNMFLKVKNSVFKDTLEAFSREGIEIPFPHLSIYTGEKSKPFPVQV